MYYMITNKYFFPLSLRHVYKFHTHQEKNLPCRAFSIKNFQAILFDGTVMSRLLGSRDNTGSPGKDKNRGFLKILLNKTCYATLID